MFSREAVMKGWRSNKAIGSKYSNILQLHYSPAIDITAKGILVWISP